MRVLFILLHLIGLKFMDRYKIILHIYIMVAEDDLPQSVKIIHILVISGFYNRYEWSIIGY